jgi:membrane protein YdbS with pleckstrin-like domain
VTTPLTVRDDGRDWHLFTVAYDTADGEFSFTIYAISFEHAAAMVEEIKQTARLSGQVGKVISV